MISAYEGGADLIVITDDKVAGNMLASLFADEPNDYKSFDNAPELRPIGSGGAATHWGVVVTVKAEVVSATNEFNSAGPYTLLNAKGINNGDVAYFKSHIQLFLKDRGTGRLEWANQLLSLNLERI